jgi:endothelin-converting enzyme/putative endopeptidase
MSLASQALAKSGTNPDAKGPDGLTPRQRFFAGNAFSWCTNIRPERARQQIQTNPHSLDKYRVNYVLSNNEAFRQAFACPAGKPMVRANPCRVW